MMVELAIGDAFGSGFECASPEFVSKHNKLPLKYSVASRRGGGYEGIQPEGCYTDDTQMSIAIAELLVSGDPWRSSRIAQKFVDCYKRDVRNGYARRFKAFLDSVSDGDEFLAKIVPNSNRSGAAMRATPLGVIADESELIQKCTIQAKLTHDTQDGVDAACASALLSHYFLYKKGAKADARRFIKDRLGDRWAAPWMGHVGLMGMESTSAAITSVMMSQSLSEVLLNSIAWTGDVDTVATIAMAAACNSDEIRNDLHEFPALMDGLENGTYGRDYLKTLDEKLMLLKQ